MYNTIMVPTDCSGFDREAVRVALRIADRSEAKVRLVRVLSTGAFFGAGASPDGLGLSVEAVRYEQEAALTELHALAAECRSLGEADITVSLLNGAVAESLERYARQNSVDLIVISSHGRHGISRISLGSITDSLIRHTTIPVLVVKPPASYLNPQLRPAFRRIIVPLDGSTLAEQILRPVMTLAKLEDAEIMLLYVLKPEDPSKKQTSDYRVAWWDKDVASARAYLFPIAERLRRDGMRVSSDVVIGDNVGEEITAYAGREKAELIAIATHGRGGLSRILRGSVADAVTRLARMSILVLHPLQTGAGVVKKEGAFQEVDEPEVHA